MYTIYSDVYVQEMIDDLRLGHDLYVICILHTFCMQDSSRYASPLMIGNIFYPYDLVNPYLIFIHSRGIAGYKVSKHQLLTYDIKSFFK